MIYFSLYLAIGLIGFYFLVFSEEEDSKKLKEEIQGLMDLKPVEATMLLAIFILFWLPFVFWAVLIYKETDE